VEKVLVKSLLICFSTAIEAGWDGGRMRGTDHQTGQLRGRVDAKAKGVKFGRKPKLTPYQQREAIRRRDVDGEAIRSIDRSYYVSVQTISGLVA
jgi:hypothetical protein